MTRAARRVCKHIIRLRHAARKPGKLIDMKNIKAETASKLLGASEKTVRQMNRFQAPKRPRMETVVKNLGQTALER